MIVLTAGYGPHAELMRLTEKHHRLWAERIGASHVLRYGPEPWPAGTEGRDGCWQKILAIQAELERMGEREVLVWIEPDVLVCDPAANPLDVMPKEADWGMVWRGPDRNVNPHFCTGVQILRNVKRVRDLLAEIWDIGPQPGLFPGDCRPTNLLLSGRERYPKGIPGVEAAEMIHQHTGLRLHPLPAAWNVHQPRRGPPATAEQEQAAICMHWSRIDKETAGRRMREVLARVAPPYESKPVNSESPQYTMKNPWPILPTEPQITTLEPQLAQADARLAGTPVHECGILFTHYNSSPLTRRNMESFGRSNPDTVTVSLATDLDVFPGSFRLDDDDRWRAITNRNGRGCWRNMDWAFWLYYANRKYNCKRWLFSDWDMHCTGPLKEFYGAAWDADCVCVQPVHPGKNEYPWFSEIHRLPLEWQERAAGTVLLSGTLVSDRAMRAMTMMAPRASYDLFCELRVGTLAQVCGFEIQAMPKPDGIRWDRRPDIKGPGLWHPVKESDTLVDTGGILAKSEKGAK